MGYLLKEAQMEAMVQEWLKFVARDYIFIVYTGDCDRFSDDLVNRLMARGSCIFQLRFCTPVDVQDSFYNTVSSYVKRASKVIGILSPGSLTDKGAVFVLDYALSEGKLYSIIGKETAVFCRYQESVFSDELELIRTVCETIF
jgi:hypothetical protein